MCETHPIPNTADPIVARIALAWEIVKTSHYGQQISDDPDERLKILTNDFIKSYLAINKSEPIE